MDQPFKYYSSHDVASGSNITQCIKIDIPIVVYRLVAILHVIRAPVLLNLLNSQLYNSVHKRAQGRSPENDLFTRSRESIFLPPNTQLLIFDGSAV